MENSKSKTAAALLAFFLGTLGVHNFYLGYIGKAIAQLSITIVTQFLILSSFLLGTLTIAFGVGFIFYAIEFCVFPFCFAVPIWAFVEFILILTGNINKSAKGYPIV